MSEIGSRGAGKREARGIVRSSGIEGVGTAPRQDTLLEGYPT
jgi:hypothetical protein